jgi:hypothetical protein
MSEIESVSEYLSRNDITNNRIASRYVSILEMMEIFIVKKGIGQNIIIDRELLKTAICDYFVDIARVKDFHGITKVNTEKIYGYMAYWLLKRKPIQVRLLFPESAFINELFITEFLLSSILAEKNISHTQCTQNAAFAQFQSLLYYNLKYRLVTQQSLELMIEAFFCGYGFLPEKPLVTNNP